jgi:SOUL heme-binding protein
LRYIVVFMKIMPGVVIIIFILFILFTYMSYASNKKVERQHFDVVKKEDGFEIRFYPKAIMATVSTPRQGEEPGARQNFRTLAGYIFGGNKAQKKIAMTAPVYMERDTNANKMSFVLPSGYKMTDLPDPNDTNIKLHYSDEGYYAALLFGGFASESKIKRKEAELKELLHKKGYEVAGAFSYLGYNAPWEIISRENEIIVKVKYAK